MLSAAGKNLMDVSLLLRKLTQVLIQGQQVDLVGGPICSTQVRRQGLPSVQCAASTLCANP